MLLIDHFPVMGRVVYRKEHSLSEEEGYTLIKTLDASYVRCRRVRMPEDMSLPGNAKHGYLQEK